MVGVMADSLPRPSSRQHPMRCRCPWLCFVLRLAVPMPSTEQPAFSALFPLVPTPWEQRHNRYNLVYGALFPVPIILASHGSCRVCDVFRRKRVFTHKPVVFAPRKVGTGNNRRYLWANRCFGCSHPMGTVGTATHIAPMIAWLLIATHLTLSLSIRVLLVLRPPVVTSHSRSSQSGITAPGSKP